MGLFDQLLVGSPLPAYHIVMDQDPVTVAFQWHPDQSIDYDEIVKLFNANGFFVRTPAPYLRQTLDESTRVFCVKKLNDYVLTEIYKLGVDNGVQLGSVYEGIAVSDDLFYPTWQGGGGGGSIWPFVLGGALLIMLTGIIFLAVKK